MHLPVPELLPRSVSDLRQGMNACLLYSNSEDPVRWIAPYVAEGLDLEERCVYVIGDHDAAHIRGVLAASGVDTEQAEARGALILVTAWEVSFPGGAFAPEAMIRYVQDAIEEALADGFRGLRVVAEMSWALRMGVGYNELIHYEALGADLYPDAPLTAVCMYNRERFAPEVCHDALRSHPLVIQGEAVYPNLYYEMPQRLAGDGDLDKHIDWMLAQLQRMREAEDHRVELIREQAARSASEARVVARDEFIAIAAHELKNPLTSVLGFSRMIERRLEQGADIAPSVLTEAVSSLSSEAERLHGLIGRLLDVSHLDSGRLQLELDLLDLRELTERVVNAAGARTPQAITLSAATECIQVAADAVRLEQVLANLLDNARKYGPADRPIEVELSVDGCEAKVSVRDYGSGVAEADRSRIFERGYQGNSHRGGLGLGLYVSSEVVCRHGGTIAVESPEGGGARFVVTLPLCSKSADLTR